MLAHFWDDARGRLLLHQRRPRGADRAQQAARSTARSRPATRSRAHEPAAPLPLHRPRRVSASAPRPCCACSPSRCAQQPFGFANLLAAVDFYTSGPREIVVVGDRPTPRDRGAARTHPRALPPQPDAARSSTRTIPLRRPPLLEGKGQVDGKPTVYVCHRMTCSPPATTWDDLAAAAGIGAASRLTAIRMRADPSAPSSAYDVRHGRGQPCVARPRSAKPRRARRAQRLVDEIIATAQRLLERTAPASAT